MRVLHLAADFLDPLVPGKTRAIAKAIDIPVFPDGDVIDLGVYKLQVAEACSGLGDLFPPLTFTYVFSVLHQGPRWRKAAPLRSAAPITVLMNSFCVGVIGAPVNAYGIEQAEGLVIFGAVIAVPMGMAAFMQRLTPDPQPLSVTLDLGFSGVGRRFDRVRDITLSRARRRGAPVDRHRGDMDRRSGARASAGGPPAPRRLSDPAGRSAGRIRAPLGPQAERALAVEVGSGTRPAASASSDRFLRVAAPLREARLLHRGADFVLSVSKRPKRRGDFPCAASSASSPTGRPSPC